MSLFKSPGTDISYRFMFWVLVLPGILLPDIHMTHSLPFLLERQFSETSVLIFLFRMEAPDAIPASPCPHSPQIVF